jgi:hypothetical protein
MPTYARPAPPAHVIKQASSVSNVFPDRTPGVLRADDDAGSDEERTRGLVRRAGDALDLFDEPIRLPSRSNQSRRRMRQLPSPITTPTDGAVGDCASLSDGDYSDEFG